MNDAAQKPALPRSMGPALATSLVIANVIGVGIFTTSGVLAGALVDPRLLLGVWVLGGILALAGAFCYAELGAQFPRAGGEYAFLREAYGPLVGFLSGWASLVVGFSAPIAAASLGFTDYLSFYFPSLSIQGANSFLAPGYLVSILIIVLFSLLHYRKVKVGGSVHLGLTSVKVGIIATFIVCGFVLGKGSFSNFAPVIPLARWGGSASSIATGLIIVMFSYSGWNAAAYIGGEIRNPQRNLPRSLVFGTLAVIAIYVAINALYIYSIPVPQMANVIRVAELATSNLFGLNISPYLNLIFMGTMLSSISAMIIAGPRVYYAMAHDGVFPQSIARVHPRFGTPSNGILLQGALAILLLFTGRFEQLLYRSGAVLILFSALTISSVYYIRKKNGGRDRAYSAWAYPWTPLLFLAVSAWMLLTSLKSQPIDLLWGLAFVVVGIPFYYHWERKMSISSMSPYAQSVMRIIIGFAFSCHGVQKLFGLLGGHQVPFPSLLWFVGVLECFGGILILAGLFTRPVAFLLCGEMAVAYFRAHASRGFFPIQNGGELAVLYCFLFLYLFAAGPGLWSLDALLHRRAKSASAKG